MEDWEVLQIFFFKAMVEGYASGCRKSKVPGKPGFKGIRHTDGNLVLVDEYAVSPTSSFSFGTTTIFADGVPVWFMSYEGYYEEGTSALLKKALKDAYSKRIFRGGRGLSPAIGERDGKGIAYLNNPSGEKNSFSLFKGKEQIIDLVSGTTLGEHRYRGGLMLPPPRSSR